ncbi:hypothetical protein [Variovorax sp. GB1P17]|uniref:hypothetical protein n=1 Tax=Variovorax sp. GB1P17 TaxID=3443740 RepID=UPI003F46EC19
MHQNHSTGDIHAWHKSARRQSIDFGFELYADGSGQGMTEQHSNRVLQALWDLLASLAGTSPLPLADVPESTRALLVAFVTQVQAIVAEHNGAVQIDTESHAQIEQRNRYLDRLLANQPVALAEQPARDGPPFFLDTAG